MRPEAPFTMNANILVLVEHFNGVLREITFEMLGVARKLADAAEGGSVQALLVGQGTAGWISQLGAADTVLLLDEEGQELLSPEVVLSLLQSFVGQKTADLILLGGTNLTFGLGARLAMRTGLPLVNFCRGVRVENGAIVCSSALFGGKMMIDIRLPGERGILNISPGSFPPEAGKGGGQTPAVREIPKPDVECQAVFRRLIEPAPGDLDITKCEVLVSVGRGIQDKENLALAGALADALGGAVSASRPVVDQGWLPLTRQVGKSGMTVKPKLYLALGISGAPEHQEGMKDSPLIVAVNTDPKAPIFDIAHYGATVDLLDLLEPLKAAVERRRTAVK